MREVRALAATGMLGSGFKEESLRQGLAWGPDFIGCDSGSTDFGPYYLGSGESNFSKSALSRDLRLILLGARSNRIPAIIGSAGTSGANVHVERILGIVQKIAEVEGLHFRLAVIHSEQDKRYLLDKLQAGKIKPLSNAPPISEEVIRRSKHIVGMAGVEPFMEALHNGAEVIIAGRSSDTSIYAALPLLNGIPPAIAWQAAKILECGAAAVRQRKYPDCMFARLKEDSFEIEPPNPEYCCSPGSVASHNLYENATPYRLVEPSGVLDTSECTYEAVSDRAVRVRGGKFTHASTYTVKLEGAEFVGYQSLLMGGIRDPLILNQLDSWLDRLRIALQERFSAIFGEGINEKYRLNYRVYGRDGVMGTLEPQAEIGHEIGLIIEITAETQSQAADLIKSAGHLAVHFPIPEWDGLITSIAFPYSPNELHRGPVYRFNMNHVVEPESPVEMFDLEYLNL